MAICKGKIKSGERKGQQCTKPAIDGRPYCRQHGGTKGAPIKHGMASKYVCEALGDSIDKFASDPEIKSLRPEIGVLRALLETVLSKITNDATQLASLSPAISDMCEKIGKIVERLVKIEDGLKLNVSVVDIHVMVNQVVEILTKEIDDEATLARIKQRLSGLTYPAN